jgi:hypothetical protein
MDGPGYSHELSYFDEVHADAASGTDDRAYLWDSEFEDLLEVVDDSARLSGSALPFLFDLTGFDYVEAESTTEGDGDTVEEEAHVFDLVLDGWWENP